MPAPGHSSIAELHALGPRSPEKTVGPQHEHDQKQYIAGHVAKPTAKTRVEVSRSQALQHSDDHRTDDAAHHAVETADDYNRKHFEADQRDSEAATGDKSP